MTERPRPGLLRLVAVVALAWLVSRAFVLWLLLDRHAWVRGDVDYFAGSLAAVPDAGLAHTLVEYPLPGVVVVAEDFTGSGDNMHCNFFKPSGSRHPRGRHHFNTAC
jgi:hypothetical protein